MTGSSDSNRSESQGGFREGFSTKEGRSKDDDSRDTNRQRGRVRAMSVRGNAKSKSHRKTHQVQPDGAGSRCSCTLPGEVSAARAGESRPKGDSLPSGSPEEVSRSDSNSAEAVVVKRTVERRKERRAEEQPKEQPRPGCKTTARSSPKRGGSGKHGNFPLRQERSAWMDFHERSKSGEQVV